MFIAAAVPLAFTDEVEVEYDCDKDGTAGSTTSGVVVAAVLALVVPIVAVEGGAGPSG